MDLNFFDIGVFLAFIGAVVGFSMLKSRKEKTSEDYFLASRVRNLRFLCYIMNPLLSNPPV